MTTRTLRPSGWKVWTTCAQSVQVARNVQPRPDTEDTIRGTACHEVGELCLLSYLPGSDGIKLPYEFVGWKASNGYIINDDDAVAVSVYTTYCLKLLNEVGGLQAMRVEQNAPAPEIHRDMWGTMDFGLYSPTTRTVYVVDYKNGVVPVDASGNGQGLIYAVHMLVANPEAERVEITIVQPNRYDSGDIISTWCLTVPEFWQWVGWLSERANHTDDPNAPYVTGNHCADCNGLLGCPAMRQAAENAVKVSHWLPPVGELTTDQMGALLTMYNDAAKALKILLNTVEPQAFVAIEKGTFVDGWAIGHGRGSRQWKKTTDLNVLGSMLDGVELHETKPVSPFEAERRGVPKKLVEALAEKVEGKRKLVRDPNNQRAKKVFENE